MQTFKDINELVKIYKLDNVVQSFFPKKELVFETENESLKRLFDKFLGVVREFSERQDYLSTEKGTIDWLTLIYQLLEVESNIIRIVAEPNYPKYDEKTRWLLQFAVDSMVNIIQRVQRWVRGQMGLLRKTQREHESLRPSVTFVLSSLEFSLLSMALAMMKVESGESKPEDIYRTVGEAIHRTTHFR